MKILNDNNVERVFSPAYVIVLLLLLALLLPFTRDFIQHLGERWIYIFMLSFSISFCLTPIVRRLAISLNVIDIPDSRKIHPAPVPLLGGVGIFVAFIFSLYLNDIYSKEVVGVISASLLIFISGLWDDIRSLSPLVRFIVQILATLLLIYSGVSIIIFKSVGFGFLLNSVLTILWIVGITNAMNFFDGMDGLATGLSILIATFLGIVSFQTDQPFLGWLAIAIVGGCLGFLPYNLRLHNSATIFLGDSGSNFLGFTLASLAVMGEWSDNSLIASLVTPILIFSILIYDMIYITISRIITGRVKTFRELLEYVGKDHLHHRMEALLFGRKRSVMFIYLLSFTMSINALVLRNASTEEAWLLLLQAIAILIVVTILEIVGNRHERRKGYK